MVLPIVHYGHPVLRKKGARITEITPAVTKLIKDMLDTMYDAEGIGLAAQQVAQALQLTVIDVREVKERPSTLELNGQPADVAAFMPLVLINPEIKGYGNTVAGPEGCLSFPEIYEDITRHEFVEVSALNAEGKPIQFKAGGLLARAIQHETDHLNSILFIDRMPTRTKLALKPELDDLQAETKAGLLK